jgi:DNA-binding NarL/FixJ family response regulator
MARDVKELLESIDSKLGALLTLSLKEKDFSLKESVVILADSGMDNQQIAKSLGISPIHVAKEKSLAKKYGVKQNG